MIKIIILLWSLIAMLFGAQLYFSNNQNIDNPDVNPVIPLTKDIIWALAFFVMVCCGIAKKRFWIHQRVVLILLTNFAVSMIFITAIFSLHGTFTPYYLTFFKNMIMYGTASYLFVNIMFACRINELFLRFTHFAITVSLFVGVLFYLIHDVKSETGRMFGCIGNPNGVGCLAVINIALAYGIIPERRYFVRMLTIAVSLISLVLSASLSAFFGLVVFVVLYHILRKWCLGQMRVLTGLGVFVLGCLLAVATANILADDSQLAARILNLLQTKESDSFATRWNDSANALAVNNIGLLLFGRIPQDFLRYDSSLLAFFYNFGLIGLTGFSLPIGLVILALTKVRSEVSNTKEREILTGLGSGFGAVVLTNLPIQYQFDVFPTNYVISVIGASIIVMVHGSRSGIRNVAANVASMKQDQRLIADFVGSQVQSASRTKSGDC